MATGKYWDRLGAFASTLRIESISIAGVKVNFDVNRLGTDPFSRLLGKIHSKQAPLHDVYGVTAHNLDEIVQVDRIDSEHECEVLGQSILTAGGSGANTCYGLGRLGFRVKVAGIVGNDAEGHMLLRSLSDAQVDTSRMIVTPSEPTGKTITLVEDGGKRFILVRLGANNILATLTSPHTLLEDAVGSRIVHLSSFVGDSEQRMQESLVKSLPEESFVSLTPGAIYSRSGLDRLVAFFSRVDAIFLYREQLLDLIQNSSAELYCKGKDVQKLLDAYFTWKAKRGISRPQVVVVKDRMSHASGQIDQRFLCVGIGDKALEDYISPRQLPRNIKVPALDSTGSGDAAAAGFLWGMLLGEPAEACVDRAFIMATFIASAYGARSAFDDLPQSLTLTGPSFRPTLPP